MLIDNLDNARHISLDGWPFRRPAGRFVSLTLAQAERRQEIGRLVVREGSRSVPVPCKHRQQEQACVGRQRIGEMVVQGLGPNGMAIQS